MTDEKKKTSNKKNMYVCLYFMCKGIFVWEYGDNNKLIGVLF